MKYRVKKGINEKVSNISKIMNIGTMMFNILLEQGGCYGVKKLYSWSVGGK